MSLEARDSRAGGGGSAEHDAYSEGWAWVRVRGRFFPDLIEARPGERLRLVFRREETAACSEQVVLPSLGRSVMLPPFEDVPVDLGPMPTGEHEFNCELGILHGRIRVRGQAQGSVGTPETRPVHCPDDAPTSPSYAASDSSTN